MKNIVKILFIAFICSNGDNAFAQKISIQSINSGGFYSQSNEMSCTIGQLAYTEFQNGFNFLTQGFQQNDLQPTSTNEVIEDWLNIEIFPNPTTENLYINTLKNDINQKLDWIIYDASGRKIMNGNTANTLEEIQMNNLESGVYFINFIMLGEKKLHQTLRFVKIKE